MSHSRQSRSHQNPYQERPQEGYQQPRYDSEPPRADYPPRGSGYYQQLPPSRPPWHKRRRARNAILASIGALVVIIAVASVLNSKNSPASANASSTAPRATPRLPVSPAAAKPTVLISFDGKGILNSAPFNVGRGPLTVHYSFNCSSLGLAGKFAADLLYGNQMYGNQSSLNSEDQTIANALAMSGKQTKTIHPHYPDHEYHLSVSSKCFWKIKVTS